MNLKEMLKNDVYKVLGSDFSYTDVIVENPKDRKMGDYAVPCFILAKKASKNPFEMANFIKESIDQTNYEKIEVIGGYINFFLKKEVVAKKVISDILDLKENYGSNNSGEGKNIVIDYSSPNIAKPFGIGHLRSTVIGNAIKNICLKNGYNVIGVNHLGDWGTQFGKMICAYKKWGNHDEILKNPIAELKKLYIKFHEEALLDASLEDEGRAWFKALENGDKEALELWDWFVEESLKEFQKTYDLLGINHFDSYNGEAFYNDKMDAVIEELEAKNLLTLSEGASVVLLDNDNPALIKKSDGATLYITRDLATAFYRKKTYDFYESLYVVGNEQILHFKQLKQVIAKMGHDFEKNMHHINFGLILQDGKKMSTRKGRTVELHDVLVEAVELAKTYVSKNPELDVDTVSRQIGIGAVIFNDLKNYRTNDIEFNLEDTLRFEGETGPYIQYTYARIISLLSKKEGIVLDMENIKVNELIWNLLFKLYEFNDIIVKAKETYDPSLVAKFAMTISQDFNKFYSNEKILEDNIQNREFKLVVCEVVSIVLKECLSILGIEAPNKM